MSSNPRVPSLPPSDSPTLALVHPTEEEKFGTWKLNGSIWRGPLSLEAYLRREVHLASQPFSQDGGVTFWILVDTASGVSPRPIFASCESYRKRAYVRKSSGHVEEVVSHGIGSVFCNPKFRKRGYARRMFIELGRSLDNWQQKDGKTADFTVLYSDIGKEFYSKLGWQPFPSTHIALHPVANDQKSSRTSAELPRVCPLYAGDLAELCKADEIALQDMLARPHVERSGASIALIPDVTTIQWHHAREEFVANELLGKAPQVKGAIVRGELGQRVWCIWTRTFGSEQEGNTLNILRIVIEGEVEKRKKSDEFALKNGSEEPNQWQILAAASILRSACLEAANWAMQDIQLWNPTHLTVLAAKQLQPTARIIEREEDSIASLRWHGPQLDPNAELTWIGNEKYGWC